MTRPALCIVADLGGTNTRVALADGAVLRTDSIRRFENRPLADDPDGLYIILRTYLEDAAGAQVQAACVALAGPVTGGEGVMTNLERWRITETLIAGATGAGRVALLNDLQAQGHALGHLEPGSLRPVITGRDPQPGASQLVVNAGTGFNAVPVHETAGGRVVPPSECGHVSLPVRSAADLALSQHLELIHGFSSVEDVLSGRGLERVDAFLANTAGAPQQRGAKQITDALAAGDPLAARSARIFVEMLGSVTGNLALTHLPFGGIYLVGGVVRHMAPYLAALGFAKGFRDKGRFSDFMDSFTVSVIEDDYAALRGCAVHLAAMMRA